MGSRMKMWPSLSPSFCLTYAHSSTPVVCVVREPQYSSTELLIDIPGGGDGLKQGFANPRHLCFNLSHPLKLSHPSSLSSAAESPRGRLQENYHLSQKRNNKMGIFIFLPPRELAHKRSLLCLAAQSAPDSEPFKDMTERRPPLLSPSQAGFQIPHNTKAVLSTVGSPRAS